MRPTRFAREELAGLVLGGLLALPPGVWAVTRERAVPRVPPDQECVYPYSMPTLAGVSVWVWKRNRACEQLRRERASLPRTQKPDSTENVPIVDLMGMVDDMPIAKE